MVHSYFDAKYTQPDIDSSSSSDCENSDERLDNIINSILANLTLYDEKEDSNMTIKKYKKERNKHERSSDVDKQDKSRNLNHYPYGAASSDTNSVSPKRPQSSLDPHLRLSQPTNPKRSRSLIQPEPVNNQNCLESQITESGNNSEDEYYMATGSRTTRYCYQMEDREMRMLLKEKKGWKIVEVEADGACLFRAVSHQIFGNEDEHKTIRDQVIKYMKQNREHFSQFISEDFDRYLLRKIDPHSHGNHVEIQAISELYNRPVEIYFNSLEPINVFHREYIDTPPIRLSYHGGVHYNSIVDPQNPTFGEGLGMPNYQPSLSESELVEKAKVESEINEIEKNILQDEIKESETIDLEDRIAEEVAKQSRLEYIHSLKSKSICSESSPTCKPSISLPSSSSIRSTISDDTSTSSCNKLSVVSDLHLECSIPYSVPQNSPTTASCSYSATSAAGGTSNADIGGASRDQQPDDYLLRHVPPDMLDMDEEAIIAMVMENSRQEYIDSHRKDKSF